MSFSASHIQEEELLGHITAVCCQTRSNVRGNHTLPPAEVIKFLLENAPLIQWAFSLAQVVVAVDDLIHPPQYWSAIFPVKPV